MASLSRASLLDEPEDTNFTQRLTCMALTRLATVEVPAVLTEKGELALCEQLFDVEALMAGALDVRGATSERQSLLMTAVDAIDKVTDILLCVKPSNSKQPKAPAQWAKSGRSLGERKSTWTFSGIASLAEASRVLAIDTVDDGEENWDYTVHKVIAIRALCEQIGALTDIGLEDIKDASMTRHKDARG